MVTSPSRASVSPPHWSSRPWCPGVPRQPGPRTLTEGERRPGGCAGSRVGGRGPLRRWQWSAGPGAAGRWGQVSRTEQDRPAGEGRARASLKRPFTEPAGFHGNPVFLFLEKEVPQQLLWVLEPRVTVGARSGEWRRVDRPRGPGRRVWRARARDRLAGPAGALGVPSPHTVRPCFLSLCLVFSADHDRVLPWGSRGRHHAG